MDLTEENDEYSEKYDLVQYGVIGLESLQYTVTNADKILTIINYGEI